MSVLQMHHSGGDIDGGGGCVWGWGWGWGSSMWDTCVLPVQFCCEPENDLKSDAY